MAGITIARSVTTLAATAALLAGSAVGASAAQGQAEPDVSGVRAALQRVVDAGAPGAFAVIRDHGKDERGRTVALGKANLDGTPMNAGLRFRVGSNSKMFTSVLVMRLAEQGRIDLDKPLRDYLPAGTLPESWAITARQVMEHRAGVYDHTNDLLEQSGEETTAAFEKRIRNNVYEPKDLVAMSVKHGLQYTPGTAYAYSNTDFVLLGLAAEHLTGRPYAELLRQQIFEPLKLRQTTFTVPQKTIAGPHVTGYLTNDDRTKPLLDSTEQTASWVWSAGGVVSSARDLDRFMTALLAGGSGGLVSDESLRQMTSVLPTGTAKISYGLGVREIALSCGKVLGHGGIVQGYNTQTFSTPDGKRTVVLFANASNNGAITSGLTNTLEPAFCGKAPAAPTPRSSITGNGNGNADRDGGRWIPTVEDTRI
ncbi:serine hydrolase domain-containing protein [Streptomyces melanogenes]|uniref:serine hydrolase domain-containing protein n=1 Tax=Streptomyces melanogenes TaxID=67326 RepID=UPI00167DCD38|nr:serine hydrolase domain-containing protein [Streptomyces melanogenes]GGP46554.1 serine hydrolase [Streptomyces melanogenes]